MSARAGIAASAVVESERVGEGVSIGEFAIVRDGAELADGVVIHPHAIVGPGVSLDEGVEVFPGAVLGKEVSLVGAITRHPDDLGRAVRIGSGCSIGANAVLYCDISIGPETLVGDTASIRENTSIGERCIIGRSVTLGYNVVIGDRTRIMSSTNITGNVSVGSDVFISSFVDSANDNSFGTRDYSDEAMRGPTIEDQVKIGLKATLLPGVVIGRSAVVGAAALVTRDVEPESVVMGVPARPVQRELPGA